FSVLIGKTGQGRKGLSKDMAVQPFEEMGTAHDTLLDRTTDCGGAIRAWHKERPLGSAAEGIQSSEALVELVRDNVVSHRRKKNRESGKYEDETVIERPAYSDKRLMIQEEEFARLLNVASRDGNTLSPIIRKAWDKGELAVNTKAENLTATGAHISIIGHVTP